MATTVSTRVRINGKNIKVQKTVEKLDSIAAMQEVSDKARQMFKAADAKNKAARPGYRKKKAPSNA